MEVVVVAVLQVALRLHFAAATERKSPLNSASQTTSQISNRRSQHAASLNDALRNRMTRQASDIVNAQFIHHLLPMLLHRLDADAQFRRDLLVRASFRNQLQHLSLTGRKLVRATSCRFPAHKRL